MQVITAYSNHSLCVGGKLSTVRKSTCHTWWPHDHQTCPSKASNCSCTERWAHYHYTSLLFI